MIISLVSKIEWNISKIKFCEKKPECRLELGLVGQSKFVSKLYICSPATREKVNRRGAFLELQSIGQPYKMSNLGT